MAVYFQPLFSGKGTILKAKKDFTVDFETNESKTFLKNDTFIVDDIIGYGFNIKDGAEGKLFRIMNSQMHEYFDIIEKKEIPNQLNRFKSQGHPNGTARLTKDFEIKDIIKIPKGQEFIYFLDMDGSGQFYDLFLIGEKERILRLKNSEFKEHFTNS